MGTLGTQWLQLHLAQRAALAHAVRVARVLVRAAGGRDLALLHGGVVVDGGAHVAGGDAVLEHHLGDARRLVGVGVQEEAELSEGGDGDGRGEGGALAVDEADGGRLV